MAGEKKEGQPKGFTVNDSRWWLRDDLDAEDVPDQVESKRPSFVEDLEAQLAEKDRLLRDYIQAHKSSVQDMGETRERLERELERRLEVERARLAEPFLDVLDNLGRLLASCEAGAGLEDLTEGVSLLLRQVGEQLGRLGLEPIVAVGARFDPNFMEALMTEEVEAARDGIVVEEIRPGYKLGDHVVRPAGVRVGVARRE